MIGLTPKQQTALDTVKNFIETHGYSPTIRELAKALNVYPKGAYDYLLILERKGFISHVPGSSRTTLIIDRDKK